LEYAWKEARAVSSDATFVSVEFVAISKAGKIIPGTNPSTATARFFSQRLFDRPADIAIDQAWTPLAVIWIFLSASGTRIGRSGLLNNETPIAAPTCEPSMLWSRAQLEINKRPPTNVVPAIDQGVQTYQFSASTSSSWEWSSETGETVRFVDKCD
jgi:hypothetical protein